MRMYFCNVMKDNVFFASVADLDMFLPDGVRVLALVDANVECLLSADNKLSRSDRYVLRVSEQMKNLETVEKIIGWLMEKEADRDTLLLGVGGGIVTDITGFAASVYKRGIRYSLVPTTLLAQVDAAIGGKTGVNFYGVKNAVGTFSVAQSIVIDIDMLTNLPEREFRSGLAEVLKTFLIADAGMYREVVDYCTQTQISGIDTDMSGWWDAAFMERIVQRCVQIKQKVVEQDRTEKGLRRVLNLGHTVGHALEAMAQSTEGAVSISHGEAVAAGIMAQARIAAALHICREDDALQIEKDFRGLGYKSLMEYAEVFTDCIGKVFYKKIIDFIKNDKKRSEDFINFVFVTEIGSVQTVRLGIEDLERVINDLH